MIKLIDLFRILFAIDALAGVITCKRVTAEV